ncbi:MAG: hypothetical protein Q4F97_08330 [Bacteroidales bacterium]|nr:hypothetical protein [Bacteroidales bacterium]
MKKSVILLGIFLGLSTFCFSQAEENENTPVTEEEEIEIIPLEEVVFVTDSLPTAEYMTFLLLEEGVIDSTQVVAAHKINKTYDQKIKTLTKNPQVSKEELQKAVDSQNDSYKATLSDQQVRAYQQVAPRFQQRNWRYNYLMNNCWTPNGWDCGTERPNEWPEWMPMYGEEGPGWMMM